MMSVRDNLFSLAIRWLQDRRACALARVVKTKGSAPCPAGSVLLIDAEGNFEGAVSSGCVEGEVITAAMEVIASGKARYLRFGSEGNGIWQAGLTCGGEIEVFVQPLSLVDKKAFSLSLLREAVQRHLRNETFALVTDLETGSSRLASDAEAVSLRDDTPIQFGDDETGREVFFHVIAPRRQIVIVGAVHIAQYLAEMARLSGFEVVINDPRMAYSTKERFPEVELLTEWPDRALKGSTILSERSALVALSHDPKIDDPALRMGLAANCFFVGALGSERSHVKRVDRLRQLDISQDAVDRISAPVGMDIGAANPREIALSILSEIVLTMRGQKWL